MVPVSLWAVNDCTNTNMNGQMNRGRSLNIARDLFEVEILIHWRYTPSSDLHSAAPTSNGVHQPIGYDSMRVITSQSPRCAETIQQCGTVL